MNVSLRAGQPADPLMLVNIPKLVTAYYTQVPDHHIFKVMVYLNDLNPETVRVELYADGLMGSAPARQEMKRIPQQAGASGGYVYSEAVSAARAPAEDTLRIILYCSGVAVPLEVDSILW